MIPYDSGISFTFQNKLNKQFSMDNSEFMYPVFSTAETVSFSFF